MVNLGRKLGIAIVAEINYALIEEKTKKKKECLQEEEEW